MQNGSHSVPSVLTTPVCFLMSLPLPRYDPPGEVSLLDRMRGRDAEVENPYLYMTDGSTRWIIYHSGPDRKRDILDSRSFLDVSAEEAITRLLPITYDPTNGGESSGDVWLLSESPEE